MGGETEKKNGVDYNDAFQVIELILDELDCKNHFTRSRVFILANQVLANGKMSLGELALFLRFHGADDFCMRLGGATDDIPTTPAIPAAKELHHSPTKIGLPAVDPNRSLLSNIQEISGNISRALNSGNSSSSLPAVTDEASVPSSRRWARESS